ncbi:MAG: type II secretion system minor pseudopilin GspK [Pseudomonadota bacterium]
MMTQLVLPAAARICEARPGPGRQTGAALLMAMMIVALITTMASAMVWQQWRAVQVESAERARTQSDWILAGALDWARLILREDARSNAGKTDHLGEPWAVPLAEARLSTFLAADKNNNSNSEEDGPEAFLSGSITDAQSRYNLRNLVTGQGTLDPKELKVLQRLFETIDISPELAGVIANAMVNSTPVNAAQAPLPGGAPTGQAVSGGTPSPAQAAAPRDLAKLTVDPHSVMQLRWFGLEVETLRRMEPYVTLLPAATAVNVNTAPREVLVAVFENMDLGTAERMTQARQRAPMSGPEDLKKVLSASVKLEPMPNIAYQTNYFEIRGRLRLDDKVLEERSLIHRKDYRNIKTVYRERLNLRSDP